MGVGLFNQMGRVVFKVKYRRHHAKLACQRGLCRSSSRKETYRVASKYGTWWTCSEKIQVCLDVLNAFTNMTDFHIWLYCWNSMCKKGRKDKYNKCVVRAGGEGISPLRGKTRTYPGDMNFWKKSAWNKSDFARDQAIGISKRATGTLH